MSSFERLKSALESFARGSASAEQRETVRAAIDSGEVTLATGERAIAVGGDANGAAFLTGDNNVLMTVSASTAEAVKQAIASLVRPSPNQLPADLPDFQGRQEQIEKLKAVLTGGGTAAVTAIGGMGGVGKSALALHVAHQLTDAAPDGRIFLDLGGTSPQPLTPLAAMITVIQGLRPEAQMPTELGPAQRLYRSCLDGKRVLLLLDNAANSAQVAPLVEWRAPTTLVIVTSRQAIAAPTLMTLRLDVMEPGEARDLLRVALSDRSATDDELDVLSERCGRLPLGLRMAGTFLALNRDWPVGEYIDALADQRRRLAWLKIEDDARLNVHAVLGFGACKLAEDKPELFERWRMLAVFPASFDRAAAAAIWSAEEDDARKGLSELLRRSMLMYDKVDGRYRLHDLMRDVALLPLETDDGALVERRLAEAATRHAQHYCRVLAAANELYLRGDENVLGGLALYDLEQRNIAAGQAWTVAFTEISDDAARLAAEYANAGRHLLLLRLTPRVRLGWLKAQLNASRKLSDRQGQGKAINNLGNAYADLGETRWAIEHFEQSLAIAREIGDRRSEGKALGNLGNAYLDLGETQRAIEHYEQDFAIARGSGDRQGEGEALGNLGNAYLLLDDTRRAIENYENVRSIMREIGDRWGEGKALANLGEAYLLLGEPRRAIEHFEQHLAIARLIGDRPGEGAALGDLGRAYAALDEPRRAMEHFEQYLAIAREIGNRKGQSTALACVGQAHAALGDQRPAIEHYERALMIMREIGDRRGEGTTLGSLGVAYAALGETLPAIEHHEEYLALAREIGDRRGEGTALFNSALALDRVGERDEAIKRMRAALVIFEQIEEPNAGRARAQLAEWQDDGNS